MKQSITITMRGQISNDKVRRPLLLTRDRLFQRQDSKIEAAVKNPGRCDIRDKCQAAKGNVQQAITRCYSGI